MIAAISFLEAPLKFRAPGVTQAIGLGIGKRVFTALNRIETVFALLLVIFLVVTRPPFDLSTTLLVIVFTILAVQTFWLVPHLMRRAQRVIDGQAPPKGRTHILFIALEAAKMLLLFATGITALASS